MGNDTSNDRVIEMSEMEQALYLKDKVYIWEEYGGSTIFISEDKRELDMELIKKYFPDYKK